MVNYRIIIKWLGTIYYITRIYIELARDTLHNMSGKYLILVYYDIDYLLSCVALTCLNHLASNDFSNKSHIQTLYAAADQ